MIASIAAITAACGSFGGGMPGPTIHFANRTIVPAAVSVNGSWVGTYASGESADVPIGGHGGPPYRIEAHSPAGIALGDFLITAGDVASLTAGASMGGSSSSDCGMVEYSFGANDEAPQPGAPLLPAPIEAGDPTACR